MRRHPWTEPGRRNRNDQFILRKTGLPSRFWKAVDSLFHEIRWFRRSAQLAIFGRAEGFSAA